MTAQGNAVTASGPTFLLKAFDTSVRACPKRPISGAYKFLLIITLAPAPLASGAAGLLVADKFVHEPLAHSLIEAFCAIISLVLSYILRSEAIEWRNARMGLMAHGFLVYGIINFFHCLAPDSSNEFILFHSVAGLAGASFFVASLFGRRWRLDSRGEAWVTTAIISGSGVAFCLVLAHSGTPAQLVGDNGSFLLPASLINLTAAAFFLAAGWRLLDDFRRVPEPTLFVFAVSMLLFSELHAMFVFSHLWDAHWWAWHFVKAFIFFALLAALAYKFAEILNATIKQNHDLLALHDRLAEMQAGLIGLEKLAALGQVAAMIAHEIRNPLGSISNCLGLLHGDRCSVDERREAVALMEREVERVETIVGETLAMARGQDARLSALRLCDVVNDVVYGLSMRQLSQVTVNCNVDQEAPLVAGNKAHLHQMIWNLLINAIEAMDGRGSVTITVERDSGDAVLRIEDSGPGIPLELTERIFEPFITTKPTGTGLGLAIVKAITSEHGATIGFESRGQTGTIVVVRFPGCEASRGVPAQ